MDPTTIASELFYGTFFKIGATYVLAGAGLSVALYLIYRTSFESLNLKTREAEELSRLHLATTEALATAIDAKDQTTHGHVRRMQIYAMGLGQQLRLPRAELAALKAAALLHDVGKLAVPPHILNKPGRLTAAEFEKVKIHTTVGAQLLSRVDFPYPVVPIVKHHHEQWNGLGYPDGLKGEQIPITARIISIVDCFDSLREDRPFRRGMTRDEAIALLRRGSGTHFDPALTDLFLELLPDFENQIAASGLPQPQPVGDLLESYMTSQIEGKEDGCYFAYDQIKEAHREVYSLYEIARTFGSTLEIEETVAVLVDKIGHVVPFDTCIVYLYDERRSYATAAHVAGKNAEILSAKCVAPGEGVTGFTLANRTAVNQLQPSLDFAATEAERRLEYRSMASVPLVKDDMLLGALSVYSSGLDQYTDDHMRLLETVTKLASDALANSLHHAEAESNALTDLLTGLPNARYLALRFEEEVSRARRTGRTFQVVMLDLDDFKFVNDTYGHKIGDKMLREMAGIIQGQLREYDFLARYAGDEFVAIVQELAGSQVEDLQTRIETAVSRFSLHVRAEHRARVGISVGTATYGTDGETLDQLLVAADQAMYRVKSAHKLAKASASSDSADRSNDPENQKLISISVN